MHDDQSIQLISLRMVKEDSSVYQPTPINNSKEACAVFGAFMANYDRETVWLACLDAQNKINALSMISLGTLGRAGAHPREIFKTALLAKAAGIMLAHNHPSGDPTPSPADRELTWRLREAGQLLCIKFLDHLILGDGDQYFSFLDAGDLTDRQILWGMKPEPKGSDL